MNNTITVAVTINVSSNKVWEYYTNPNYITNWNFAHETWQCPTATNDLWVGGTYNARMEAKDGSSGFNFEAIYTKLDIGKSFTYKFGNRYATVLFTPNINTTELIITFDPETEHTLEMQKNGWQAILNNFKTYTESN